MKNIIMKKRIMEKIAHAIAMKKNMAAMKAALPAVAAAETAMRMKTKKSIR